MKRRMPLWAVFLADLAVFGVALCAFAYFHHVRDFLSIGADTPSAPETIFTKPTTSSATVATVTATAATTVTASRVPSGSTATGTGSVSSGSTTRTTATASVTAAPLPTQPPVDPGDFGHLHGERFLPMSGDAPVELKDDAAIRAYLRDNGFGVSTTNGGKYIGLYRSHNIFLTVEQVTDRIIYEGNNKYSPEVYYVYDTYVRNIENLYSVTVSKRDGMQALIDKGEADSGGRLLGAVNGDYSGNVKRCMVAVRNGQLLRSSQSVIGDICVLYYDGVMQTIPAADYKFSTIAARSPYQIWCFGPSLLHKDGTARLEAEYDTSAYDNNLTMHRHPRTAIGYYEPGHYALLVVDGRTADSYGLRMLQLGRLFEAMGCKVAYNFDGGDSCQAYYDGQFIRQAEGRDEQRELYDIVCIGEVNDQ